MGHSSMQVHAHCQSIQAHAYCQSSQAYAYCQSSQAHAYCQSLRTDSQVLDQSSFVASPVAYFFPHLIVHTSPTGLIPKPHSESWKVIVDLSSPWGSSINEGISTESCSLNYSSIDDAVNIITHLGAKC